MQGVIRISFFIFLLTISVNFTHSQVTYEQSTNFAIYDFLDELANDRIISLNSCIKPYSRKTIYEKLLEANKIRFKLNRRQQKELEYYLNNYKFIEVNKVNPYSEKARLNLFENRIHASTSLNPFGFFYKDSLFSLSLRPIWGIKYWSQNSNSKNITQTWGGGELVATIGKNFGFYASLRDNRITEVLAKPGYFSSIKGGSYQYGKSGRIGADFNEMIGGVVYSWKWGELGVIKDNIIWGDNYNGSNIFSGRTPSFPMVKLHINPAKWFDFNYFHGWLISEVIDSSRSYITANNSNRLVYRNKFLAANMFTIIPLKGLNISVGNSIVYGDIDINPGYLIPFFFFKSVDHTINREIDNQNSQMYGSISMRLIKHWHIYSSLFVDEFKMDRMFNDSLHNFFSFKVGSKLSNWPFNNISIMGEYTRSNPLAFKHRVPTLTFESNKFNLGHYLVDNSEEIFIAIFLKPLLRLKLNLSYLYAKHGNEYVYDLQDISNVDKNPVLKDKTWDNQSISFLASYEFLNNCYISIEYLHSNISGYAVDGNSGQYYLDLYTPDFYQGVNNTIILGFNFGF